MKTEGNFYVTVFLEKTVLSIQFSMGTECSQCCESNQDERQSTSESLDLRSLLSEKSTQL